MLFGLKTVIFLNKNVLFSMLCIHKEELNKYTMQENQAANTLLEVGRFVRARSFEVEMGVL